MKTIICNSPGKLELINTARPELKPGHALIRIRRIGICGTDLHAFEGTQPYFSYPRILGHELAGEIIDIDGTDEFVKGELVTFIPYINCQECPTCRRGFSNCCENIRVFGVHVDGGMREEVVIPVRLLLKINQLEPNAVALVEPLAIAAHAVRRAQVAAGEHVLVMGGGPIGAGIIQFAQLKGATVTLADVSENRLEFGRDVLSADHIVNPLQKDARDQMTEITGSRLYPVVFDATGNINALNSGFTYMAYTGRYVLVGLQQKEIQFSHPEFHKREGNLMSSRNATREDFTTVLDAIHSGNISPAKMITHRVKFSDVPGQFASWLDPKTNILKVIVELD